jgi:DsbE subfamily thiol:disulfide oxidoreductase
MNRFTLGLGVAVLVGFAILPRIASSQSAMVGKQAPEFALPAILNAEGADRVPSSSFAGQPVVLSFWASWCGPCRAEAPSVDRLYQRLQSQGVAVVGINTNDDPDRAIAFARQKNLSFPILSDEDGKVGAAFGVSSLPTLVIVDKSGVIVAVRSGMTDESSLESLALSAR